MGGSGQWGWRVGGEPEPVGERHHGVQGAHGEHQMEERVAVHHAVLLVLVAPITFCTQHTSSYTTTCFPVVTATLFCY